MSTRSTIWLKQDDGSYKGVYCHFDGYVKHTGKTLAMYYNTKEKVEQLINLGHLSHVEKYLEPPEGVEHDFNNQVEDVTVAYHRDRGELKEYYQADSLEEIADNYAEEYNYIFIDGKWYFFRDSDYDELCEINIIDGVVRASISITN